MESQEILRKTLYDLERTKFRLKESINKISEGKPRILFVAPHLSTGGMPQYLLKKIEMLLPDADIFCVQFSNTTDEYVVQKNQIRSILNNRFYCLGEDKNELISIIDEVCPDVIHFDDFIEFFLPEEISEKIYHPSRPYFIFETCHSSNIDPMDKIYCPDKFVMVNEWMVKKFKDLGVPMDVFEYPITDLNRITREEALANLGLDPEKKHVINIGLFTPGKNQGELIDHARQMTDLPIQFHFIGNTAPNFENYWGPLLSDLPSNCKLWGERHDTDKFYQAADLFVFTSIWELNPIVIKESLSWKTPILMRRLAPYMDSYDNNQLVSYLTSWDDFYDKDRDMNSIKHILGFQ